MYVRIKLSPKFAWNIHSYQEVLQCVTNFGKAFFYSSILNTVSTPESLNHLVVNGNLNMQREREWSDFEYCTTLNKDQQYFFYRTKYIFRRIVDNYSLFWRVFSPLFRNVCIIILCGKSCDDELLSTFYTHIFT